MTFQGFLQKALEENYLNNFLADEYGNCCYCGKINVYTDGIDPQVEILFSTMDGYEHVYASNVGKLPRRISFEEYTELKKKKNEKTI